MEGGIGVRGLLTPPNTFCGGQMQRRCYYCNVELVKFVSNKQHRLNPPNGMTQDHMLPIDRGGKGLAKNKVYCCCNCNIDKARLTLAEYRLVVAFRNGKVGESDFKFPGEK
jgi:hypothetical protein